MDGSSSEAGPRGTFESYKAEGDLFFKLKQYNKAIDAFTTALELSPNDKNCLIARSKCYIQIGESNSALKDAESSLEDDSTYHKGLLQKAEVLYSKGEFEIALVLYHRGYKLRPECREFTLGISKAEEAIDNCVGTPDRVKLTKKGDLSFFHESDEIKRPSGYRAYLSSSAKKSAQKKKERPKGNEKSIKQLLGELYKDKEYLEKLLDETDTNSPAGRGIYELVWDGLSYLDTRTEFWRQQKPLNAGKRDKTVRYRASAAVRGKFPPDHVIQELEKIEEMQNNDNYQESLKKSKECLKFLKNYDEKTIKNKREVIANLHSYMGNAYLETGEYEKALNYHQKDFDFADSNGNSDARSRSLDNLGRVYARIGQFQDAITVWSKKISQSKSALESAWLYHEIGRCHLELDNNSEALSCGERSVTAAEEAGDEMWLLNAVVLVAQAQLKLEHYNSSCETFMKALDMSKSQGDGAAEGAIIKALAEVRNKISQAEAQAEDRRRQEEEEVKGEVEDQKQVEHWYEQADSRSEESDAKADESETGEEERFIASKFVTKIFSDLEYEQKFEQVENHSSHEEVTDGST